MFRDIVSNLSLSPAASTHLTYYWRRLRREQLTRQLAVVMAALLLILQTAIIVAPPDAADAASPNDIICGGLGSNPQATLLQVYDKDADNCGHGGYHQLFGAFGITRNDLVNAHVGSVYASNHSIMSIGRDNEFAQDYAFTAGGSTYYYQRPLYLWGQNLYSNAVIGTTDDGHWFAVLDQCGNIATVNVTPGAPVIIGEQPQPVTTTSTPTSTPVTPAPTPTPVESKPVEAPTPVTPTPVPGQPNLLRSKTVLDEPAAGGASFNANGETAQAGDTLQYTLTVANTGTASKEHYVVSDDINDVLQYAVLLNPDGATLTNGVLTWPATTIKAGTSQIDTFEVKVMNPIPTTPTSTSDPLSYDLKMQNTYGNQVTVNLPAPAPKQVEAAAASLPQTGAGTDTLIVLVLVAAIAYFYFRNRQLITEIGMLRGDHHGPGGNS